jgi:ribosomal protein S18 acetylase RimI-like enzyme
MPFTVRAMTPGDYPAAVALWRVTPGIGLNDADTEPNVVSFLARNPGLSAVAFTASGELAGAVLCGHDGRRGYLHHLAVALSSRRQGVARSLIEHAFAGLRALGIQKCNVFLYADNHEGRAFWTKNGWSVRADLQVVQKALG